VKSQVCVLKLGVDRAALELSCLVAVAERLFGLTQIVVALLPIVMLSGYVHAQESDGEHNHGYALLSGSRSRFPGLGVGEFQVAAGQIA
jgi:hypothetical protein